MLVTETKLPGVHVIEPRLYHDNRGAFAEYWRGDRYSEAGISDQFVQDNVSWSAGRVLRGLHFQNPMAQAKLITALHGTIFDVAVDVRPESPTFGDWVGVELSAESMKQLYIPAGFAHGFLVLSDRACVSYKCSNYYAPQFEQSLRWNDPQVGIEWPIDNPILSAKDAEAKSLNELFNAMPDSSIRAR